MKNYYYNPAPYRNTVQSGSIIFNPSTALMKSGNESVYRSCDGLATILLLALPEELQHTIIQADIIF